MACDVVCVCVSEFSLCSQDPDSIVMTIDMHLTLPPGFVEYVRRVRLPLTTTLCVTPPLPHSMWCRGRWGLPLCSSDLIKATLKSISMVSIKNEIL